MDDAEKWLMKNDPLYYKPEQRARLPHPYLTAYQLRWRASKEIPVSNLWACRGKLGLNDDDAQEIIEQLK